MLPPSYLTACLYGAISAAGLLALLALYRDYRIDRLRDDLFAARDKLFDYAVKEGLLTHPGYRHLRDVFNGMLRFCHKISFSRLALSIALSRIMRQEKKPFEEWVRSIQELPRTQQEALTEYHLRMFVLVLVYLSDTSLILFPIIGIFRVKNIFQMTFRRAGQSIFPELLKRTERGWEFIEEEALEANKVRLVWCELPAHALSPADLL